MRADRIKKDALNPNTLFAFVEELAREKRIDKDAVIKNIREPLVLAIKKDYPGVTDAEVDVQYYIPKITDKTPDDIREKEYAKSKFEVNILKTVTADEDITNNNIHISTLEACLYVKNPVIGEQIPVPIDTFSFMRTSASSAKQRFRQNVRDAEKTHITKKWKNIIGKVLTAEVDTVFDNGDAKVKLLGAGGGNNRDFDITLFKIEQVPGEILRAGDLKQVYVAGVHEVERRTHLKISRVHKELVRILLEREVPEISQGVVEIKSTARICGVRTKISVLSKDENVSAIGACLGEKNSRIEKVLYEIRGRRPSSEYRSAETENSENPDDKNIPSRKENIDIISYKDDPAEYIIEALKPAIVKEIKITSESETELTADVICDDENMTGVIGAKGFNAKLAALLTGYVLDIIPESGIYKSKPGEFNSENAENSEQTTEDEI